LVPSLLKMKLHSAAIVLLIWLDSGLAIHYRRQLRRDPSFAPPVSLHRQPFRPPHAAASVLRLSATRSESLSFIESPSGGGDSELARILDSLPEADKYNTLAQGLFRRVLNDKSPDARQSSLQEGWTLLDEMRQKALKATPRTFSLLVDAAAVTNDAEAMKRSLELATGSGLSVVYGQADKGWEGSPVDAGRLASVTESLTDMPEDSRSKDVVVASAFMGYVGTGVGAETLGDYIYGDFDEIYPTVALLALAAAGVYDIVKGGGVVSKSVVAGLKRLLVDDKERQCRVESAAFLVAYLLGLPCFCFRPNVLEALKMAEDPRIRMDLLTPAGIDKLLVWLLAGVAAENLQHPECIVADPRQSDAFVKLMRDKDYLKGVDDETASLRVKWAFHKATNLLRKHRRVHDELRRRMESKAATVGDCVTFLEKEMAPRKIL